MLEITFGPMFSGKTTYLSDDLHRYIDWNKSKDQEVKCLLINYAGDNRDDCKNIGNLTTHSSLIKTLNEEITTVKVHELKKIPLQLIQQFDYIGVDEAHLFDDIEVIEQWIPITKKIHCSGLIATSEKKSFKLIEIFRLASILNHKTALCYAKDCDKKAPFTICIEPKKDKKLIGGASKYRASCEKHYYSCQN